MPNQLRVDREGNLIRVSGVIRENTFKRLLAAIHNATEKAGYSDLVLDASGITRAYPSVMLATCAQLAALRNAGIYTSPRLPQDTSLGRLFRNANWANLIDPRQYDPVLTGRSARLPATQFKSPSEQRAVVDRVVRSLLESLPDLERSQFSAFEWSIHEITDNVLVHSQSDVGGFVQVSLPSRSRNVIEFDVCDPGKGIPSTLLEGHPELRSDTEALDLAIRANLRHTSDQILQIAGDQIPYSGTAVICRVDFSERGVLEKALKFRGSVHTPVDYIETHYIDDAGRMLLRLENECSSFGSRAAAAPVRQRLENLMRLEASQRVIGDFDGIPLVSSSFADELVGKLFVSLGPITFMQRVEIRNTNELVRRLIDRAVMQRGQLAVDNSRTAR